MDIDLDLDYSSDRISDFLRSKLKEIQSENAHLEDALRHRQEIASQLREEIAQNQKSEFLKISEIWKRVSNGKYVIGVDVTNESEILFDTPSVTLNWTSPSPLTYKFHLVSALSNSLTDGLKFTPHLAKSGHVIIILDVPLFTTQLSYTISGCLTFGQQNKKIILNLRSNIEVTPRDVTDNASVVDLLRVIEGNVKDLITLALAGEKHEFVLMLPEGGVIEVDSGFTKTSGKFFVGFKVCPTLEGALFEIVGDDFARVVHLNTYCKDLQTTTALLHHLHRSIEGVSIIPKSLYQPDLSPSEMSELVKNSLIKELEELEKGSKDDLKALRSRMMPLEHQTDILISRISEKTPHLT